MDINTSMQATAPIRKDMEVILVDQNKTAQKKVKELSEPLKVPVFEDFSVEISQLSKKMQQTTPEMSKQVLSDLSATLRKQKSVKEEVEDLFDYRNDEERFRERLTERLEEEFEKYNRVEPKPGTYLFEFEDDIDITTSAAIEAAEEMKDLIDVTGALVEDKKIERGEPLKKEDQTPTEKIREQMGNYVDTKGPVPEDKREQNPVENAKKSQEQLKEVTGKLINRPEEWQVEGNKPQKSEAEKSKERLGSEVDKNGVAQDTKKSFPEKAEERLSRLDEKMGELIDKPKELTGKEKTDEMTPAEKANVALGNKLKPPKSASPVEKKEQTPPEKAEEKMKTMVEKMGERVDKHKKITGEDVDENASTMEKAKIMSGNRIDKDGVVPEDERKKAPPEEAEEDMEKMIEMMGQLMDKPEEMTGKKDKEGMSETEKTRELMGGRTSVTGILPDDERTKRPPEQANENMEKMIEKMGERIDKTQELSGQKNTEKMSEMQKAKDLYGGRLDAKGVVSDEDRNKNPVEEAKEKAEELKEQQGELVDKREEITGEENREQMTEAQKANEDMGNFINKEGIASEEERDHRPAERVEKRIEDLDEETGRLVEDAKNLADSRVAPISEKLTGKQQRDFVATAKKLDQTGGPNMDKYISTTNQLIEKHEEEQLKNYLSGAQDQSGVGLSMYLTAAAQRHLFT